MLGLNSRSRRATNSSTGYLMDLTFRPRVSLGLELKHNDVTQPIEEDDGSMFCDDHWPDCRFPHAVLSPRPDIKWYARSVLLSVLSWTDRISEILGPWGRVARCTVRSSFYCSFPFSRTYTGTLRTFGPLKKNRGERTEK
jgi:hypothetical protein